MCSLVIGVQTCALPIYASGKCLPHEPRLVVGGNGVSGPAIMDNADLRKYLFEYFHVNVLDMESAAVAQVAYSNGVPFIVFRSEERRVGKEGVSTCRSRCAPSN